MTSLPLSAMLRAGLRRLRLVLIFATAIFCAFSFTGFAQRVECREPTAAERAAVENAQRVLRQAVELPVVQLGWKLRSQKADGGSPSVATDASPKRPLMRCWPIYDARFDLTAAHPQFNALHSAAGKGQEQMNAWMAECIKNNYKGCDVKPASLDDGPRATAALTLQIRVLENDPYMHLTQPEKMQKLDVPGAGVAWSTESDLPYLTNTTVCAGPWKPEIVFASKRDVPFPFQHGPGTAFIENLCVRITASEGMADEILHKVDWKQLNAALTR